MLLRIVQHEMGFTDEQASGLYDAHIEAAYIARMRSVEAAGEKFYGFGTTVDLNVALDKIKPVLPALPQSIVKPMMGYFILSATVAAMTDDLRTAEFQDLSGDRKETYLKSYFEYGRQLDKNSTEASDSLKLIVSKLERDRRTFLAVIILIAWFTTALLFAKFLVWSNQRANDRYTHNDAPTALVADNIARNTAIFNPCWGAEA